MQIPDRAFAPHCDQWVLHAPGRCQHCDKYSDWQKMREMWDVNFTGERDPNKRPCPSEERRPLERIERWGGNRARRYDAQEE